MSKGPQEYRCAPDRALLGGLRSSVRDQLEAWDVDIRATSKIVLVVDEMVGNSIDHGGGYRGASTELMVAVAVIGTDVEVSFVDPDAPESLVSELREQLANATEPPPLDAERGRGLYLIGSTLEDVLFAWEQDRGMTISGKMRGVAG